VTPCQVLVLACGLVLGADNQDSTMKEYAQFEGVWRFALVEVEGVKQPEAPFETNKLIVSKEGNYVIVQGPRITRGIIRVDPTKTPKHYDVTITAGPAKGRTALGVYEMDGDSFKVCLPLRGKDRPPALVSKAGSGCLVHVFKRENQDVKEALIAVGRMELAGRWQAVSYALDGKKATEADMKKVQLVFDTEGKTQALNDGKVFIASTTKIDPTSAPMAIDVTFTDGDLKGMSSLGIYKIEDDLLTICRSAPGKARPSDYSSTPGSGQTLMAYERMKDQKR
jgi:uncharacterized protein (TIGR03067 family)